jgi:hypothetical protein
VRTEGLETLDAISKQLIFEIRATDGIDPIVQWMNLLCLDLDNDVENDFGHCDPGEVSRGLHELGVTISNLEFADYPHELWKNGRPTPEWICNELPLIFGVLNDFGHGIQSAYFDISYDNLGIYHAVIQHAYSEAAPEDRPIDWHEEDLTLKYGGIVLETKLAEELYAAVRSGQLSMEDAISRLGQLLPAIRARFPERPPTALIGSVPSWVRSQEDITRWLSESVPQYGPAFEELKDWALNKILTNSVRTALH